MRFPTRTPALAALLAAITAATPLAAQSHDQPAATVAPSPEAKQAFALLKSLTGSWQGSIVDPMTRKTVKMDITLRTLSRGNTVVHEMKASGVAEDPAKNDHPVTMLYLDGPNLLLTHYCDAGNRPRMAARISPDGKTIDFDFIDVAGPTTHGHMQHVRFTVIDDNHHVEAWTYEVPGGGTMTGEFELERVTTVASNAPVK